MRLSWCAPFVGLVTLLSGTVLTASPAAASTVPDYETPFPCGQEWTGTTRSNHRPSAMSIDFNRPGDLSDIVVATAPGVVTRVADTGGTSYGRYVVVDHGEGRSSLYAHLKKAWVSVGHRVDQGAVLGLVGASGGVTGAHLHFEQRLGNQVEQPYFHGTAFAFGTTAASLNCPDVPLAGDWNSDRADEVAVFRRLNGRGTFRLHVADGAPEVIGFGRSSDIPVTGDWDGDGRTDVGVRRQGKRLFLLRGSDGSAGSVRLGKITDVPVTGDWNGDGVTDVGVWRPTVSAFRLLVEPGVIQTVRLGGPGAQPVAGDWDGDGVTDLGVHDPATATFTLRRVGADGGELLEHVPFGSPSDLPVAGDWDGDGVTDVGTWTPTTATYSLRMSSTMARTDAGGPAVAPAAGVVTQRFGRRR